MSGRALTLVLEAGMILAWSSGFIGAKLAAETPSAFLVLFWRFVLVALCLSPLVVQAIRRGRIGGRELWLHTLLGIFAMFAYLAGGIRAIEVGASVGTVALIGALQPLATAALAGPVLGETVSSRQWLGLVIGFAGVLLAVGSDAGTAPLWAYGLAFLGMAAIVVATLIAKARPDATPLLPALGLQSAVAALLFLPLAAFDGSLAPLWDAQFLAGVAWFIVFSTLGGYGLYWLCLKRSTATRVASLIYLTPPVVMVWAWLMFDEALTAGGIAGFGLCLLGIVLANRSLPTAQSCPAR